MPKYAVIKDGVVVNIAEWDGVSPWESGGDSVVDVSLLPVGKGASYDGQDFVAADPVTIPLNEQYTPQKFGLKVLADLGLVVKGADSAKIFDIAKNLSPFLPMLYMGLLQPFLDNLGQLPIDGIIITKPVIDQMKQELSEYLDGK